MSGLQWKPADFWPATLAEFFDAIDAANEARGEDGDRAPSQDEVAKLIARYG